MTSPTSIGSSAGEKAEAPPAPAGTAIVAVAGEPVQVRLGPRRPALRQGDVLVAGSDEIEGFRNLGPTEARLFWIVYA